MKPFLRFLSKRRKLSLQAAKNLWKRTFFENKTSLETLNWTRRMMIRQTGHVSISRNLKTFVWISTEMMKIFEKSIVFPKRSTEQVECSFEIPLENVSAEVLKIFTNNLENFEHVFFTRKKSLKKLIWTRMKHFWLLGWSLSEKSFNFFRSKSRKKMTKHFFKAKFFFLETFRWKRRIWARQTGQKFLTQYLKLSRGNSEKELKRWKFPKCSSSKFSSRHVQCRFDNLPESFSTKFGNF